MATRAPVAHINAHKRHRAHGRNPTHNLLRARRNVASDIPRPGFALSAWLCNRSAHRRARKNEFAQARHSRRPRRRNRGQSN